MLLLPHPNHLLMLHQEKIKEHQRQSQQLRWLQEIEASGNPRPYRQILNWAGAQMVKWGTKLQSYEPTPPLNGLPLTGKTKT
jgi:hypothetical protein